MNSVCPSCGGLATYKQREEVLDCGALVGSEWGDCICTFGQNNDDVAPFFLLSSKTALDFSFSFFSWKYLNYEFQTPTSLI